MQKDKTEIITNPVTQPETGLVKYAPEPCEENIQNLIGQLDSSLMSLGCGITIMRCDYTIKYQSRLMRERFGDSKGGKCYRDYLNQSQPCEGCPVGKSPLTDSFELRGIRAKDGKSYRLLLSPLRISDGGVDVLEAFQEMTEEKTSEEKIAFMTGIVNHTPESIIATDQEGRII